jgi:hypothetical protein
MSTSNMTRYFQNDLERINTQSASNKRFLSRNCLEFNNENKNIIKLNLIGQNDEEISVEDLSSSEVDQNQDSISKRLKMLNLSKNNE